MNHSSKELPALGSFEISGLQGHTLYEPGMKKNSHTKRVNQSKSVEPNVMLFELAFRASAMRNFSYLLFHALLL